MRSFARHQSRYPHQCRLPRAMPYFFASLKVAITQAFVGTVIAETVASNRGIGNFMLIASSNFDVPLVFAGLLILAVLGVGLYVIFSLIENSVTGLGTPQGFGDGGNRHSGAPQAANPESITPDREYGFRVPSLRAGPGMTSERFRGNLKEPFMSIIRMLFAIAVASAAFALLRLPRRTPRSASPSIGSCRASMLGTSGRRARATSPRRSSMW